MAATLIIFLTQFVYVALLGLQSRIVNWGGKRAAMMVSLCLGSFGLFINEAIAKNALQSGDSWFRGAYIIAGPLGVATAMALHDRYGGKKS